MKAEEIQRRYEHAGELSAESLEALAELLDSPDPYSAITLAADLDLRALSAKIAGSLDHEDPMTRWNAVSALGSRMRQVAYASRILKLAELDPDELVRVAALSGLGSLIRDVEPRLRNRIAAVLIETTMDSAELPELRGAAYEGILESLETPIMERPDAGRLLVFPDDLDLDIVNRFREKFGQ